MAGYDLRYTVKDLIQAYINVIEYKTLLTGMHSDLKQSRQARFDAFSKCFDVRLEKGDYDAFPDYAIRSLNDHLPENARGRVMTKDACWSLFQSAIESYLAIQTPFSGSLESPGKFFQPIHAEFADMAGKYRAMHWKLLTHLFRLMYGDILKEVTSDDLIAVGYDDSNQPDEDLYF